MTLTFVTTNKHKFQEVEAVLSIYGITLVHLDREYEENHDASIEEVARGAAKKLAEELQLPLVLEDTGLFFAAYPAFPGALPKFVFNTLGYKGIFKLLNGEPRGAYFKTVAAYCEPGQSPLLFEGRMDGVITEKVFDSDKDYMPYDRIFIPAGKDKTISQMTLAEKNSFSQRAQAFRKLGQFLEQKPTDERSAE